MNTWVGRGALDGLTEGGKDSSPLDQRRFWRTESCDKIIHCVQKYVGVGRWETITTVNVLAMLCMYAVEYAHGRKHLWGLRYNQGGLSSDDDVDKGAFVKDDQRLGM